MPSTYQHVLIVYRKFVMGSTENKNVLLLEMVSICVKLYSNSRILSLFSYDIKSISNLIGYEWALQHQSSAASVHEQLLF